MSKGRGNSGGDEAIGCLVLILLGLFILPLIGIVMLLDRDEEVKSKGAVLLILGLIIWLVILCFTYG